MMTAIRLNLLIEEQLALEAEAGVSVHRVHVATDDAREYAKSLERLMQ